MLNMVSINLDSITTQEAFIINKAPIDGKEMKLTLSRKCTPTNDALNKYIGYCSAEMRFADELDVDMLDTSFLVKVVLSAEFSSPDCSTKFSTDELTEYALLQMFPHVRATLASIMASAGLTPYLIPTNGIIQ